MTMSSLVVLSPPGIRPLTGWAPGSGSPTVAGVNTSNLTRTLKRAPAEFLYIGTSVPLGIAWLVGLVVLLAVGVATSIVIIGIPLLVATVLLTHWGANTERERAALVLG